MLSKEGPLSLLLPGEKIESRFLAVLTFSLKPLGL